MSELLKPRTATVVIYQGDDLETLGDLRREAERADRRVEEHRRSGAPRRDGDELPSAKPQKDAYDAFVAEAAERAVTVTLRALGRRRFRDLVADHPPRISKDDEGNETTHPDDGYGVNAETFPMALLTFVDSDMRTITEPEFSTSAALREFLDDVISEGDFDSLWTTAYFLNRSPGADPKVSRYSTDSPSSVETLT
jgi:hypothetical protein